MLFGDVGRRTAGKRKPDRIEVPSGSFTTVRPDWGYL
jgi:hypothetical protein